MPAYQGEFDGLCGMYSIANAYESCGYIDHGNQLFQVACSRLAPKRWPRVLWEGTSFHDMMRMIKACQRYICQERLGPVVVRYPFRKADPKSNDSFWEQLENESLICGIVGLTKPWRHWVVISPDTKRRIWFTDSSGDQREYRKNLASLHAGERRPYGKPWLINRRELIVFSTPDTRTKR